MTNKIPLLGSSSFWPPISGVAGILYFALAASTILATAQGNGIATIWPADAVLVAVMMMMPRTGWPSVLVAGFVANVAANAVTRGFVWGQALFGFSNMTGVLIVALGMHFSSDRDASLRKLDSVVGVIFWAGLVGPGVSALLGAASASLIMDQPFTTALGLWYFADALGLLVFVPVFTSLLSGDFLTSSRKKSRAALLEACVLLAITLAVAVAVFENSRLPLLFLLTIPITLVTFRVGWQGTKIAVMIVAIVGAIATMHGDGPFILVSPDPRIQAIAFQIVLVTLLLTHMPVAAALNSRMDVIEELAQRERSTRLLAREAGILLLVVDRKGRCLKAVGAAERLLGKAETEIIGQRLHDISHVVARNLGDVLSEVDVDDGFDQIIEFEAHDSPDRWLEAKFGALEVNVTGNFDTIITIQDVTDRKRLERNLTEQAERDALTGLLNRRGFNEKASRALTRPQGDGPFLAMIDVDRFKLVNDNLGHEAGDMVLKAIAGTMVEQLRATDTLGRLGGDEFAMLLDTPTEQQARDAADRLVKAVAAQKITLPGGTAIQIAISCGLARYRYGSSLEDLKNAADIALYEAKRGGRNQLAVA